MEGTHKGCPYPAVILAASLRIRIAPRAPGLGIVTFCEGVTFSVGVAHGERIVGATLVVALRRHSATLGRRLRGPFQTGWRRCCPRGNHVTSEGTHKGCPYRAAILADSRRMAAAASSTSASLMPI